MKFGIITLVSDNYGNKYQNYAVEQLLSEYGEVQTYGLENLYEAPLSSKKSKLAKFTPSYIREVLISRPMYQYDITRLDKGIIHNLVYAKKHSGELIELRNKRSKRFKAFSDKYLHISSEKLNRENTTEDWSKQIDYFICGSDQIWNPSYATTSELAFCSFAPEKTICISPSFGVSEIPEYRRAEYAEWLKEIYKLSVRENAGQKIIKDLTNRDAEVFLDPTMLISVEKWVNLCKKPQANLPKKYILCYFLGRITKEYKEKIDKIAAEKGLPVVMLFDIMTPQYYTMNPAEVLFAINHADCVLTDSFHGSVFSILFHKDFIVFNRDEGGSSMNSRLETLLGTFGLSKNSNSVSDDKWHDIDAILNVEKSKIKNYLKCLD